MDPDRKGVVPLATFQRMLSEKTLRKALVVRSCCPSVRQAMHLLVRTRARQHFDAVDSLAMIRDGTPDKNRRQTATFLLV